MGTFLGFVLSPWESDVSLGRGLQGKLNDKHSINKHRTSPCVLNELLFALGFSVSQQAPLSLLTLPLLFPGSDILES